MNPVTETFTPEKARQAEERFHIIRRSVDARQKELKINLTFLTDNEGHRIVRETPIPLYEAPVFKDVHAADKAVNIVGAGPAGLFAALILLESGIRPIIFERGKDVSSRKRDIANLNRNLGLNSESNYCFGEGGAGTFSDGKLFSRSKKRGNMQRVMELFHYFGAPDTILYEAHAHIGSDKLPNIIKRMRECIIEHGGEVHFETCITSIDQISDRPTILAIGHSAHDTYRMLFEDGVAMEQKGFAMGVRVEHPQQLINKLMYHNQPQNIIDIVGSASYALVTQVDGRGVYSFCMCPGGHIVPAGSTPDSCIVNGMSVSRRNSPYANSGIVVEICPDDFEGEDALAGLRYQELVEHLAFKHGGPKAQAPAQRMKDFVDGKLSETLPTCSYLPGMVSSRLDEWLPAAIGKRLQQGFRNFDNKYHGFLTNEAVILGIESRSSSAVRITRDAETMQSPTHQWLYPSGEGAGYAGGITSSALDGINAALSIINSI